MPRSSPHRVTAPLSRQLPTQINKGWRARQVWDALTTCGMPIEGRDEWMAAAGGRLA